jgi:hypothetical protein
MEGNDSHSTPKVKKKKNSKTSKSKKSSAKKKPIQAEVAAVDSSGDIIFRKELDCMYILWLLTLIIFMSQCQMLMLS